MYVFIVLCHICLNVILCCISVFKYCLLNNNEMDHIDVFHRRIQNYFNILNNIIDIHVTLIQKSSYFVFKLYNINFMIMIYQRRSILYHHKYKIYSNILHILITHIDTNVSLK